MGSMLRRSSLMGIIQTSCAMSAWISDAYPVVYKWRGEQMLMLSMRSPNEEEASVHPSQQVSRWSLIACHRPMVFHTPSMMQTKAPGNRPRRWPLIKIIKARQGVMGLSIGMCVSPPLQTCCRNLACRSLFFLSFFLFCFLLSKIFTLIHSLVVVAYRWRVSMPMEISC
jgi:hypothetical protein